MCELTEQIDELIKKAKHIADIPIKWDKNAKSQKIYQARELIIMLVNLKESVQVMHGADVHDTNTAHIQNNEG